MEKYLQIIDKLITSVRIIREHARILRDENYRLKQEFETLKQENKGLFESLKEKEEELRMARLAQGVNDPKQTAALKAQIQRMIKDIDKSIALLSDTSQR